MVTRRSALAGLLLVTLLAAGQARVAASPLTTAVCGTWVIFEPPTLTDLNRQKAQIESALSLPGVVGLSLRFRWSVVDTDFSLLEAGLAIAQGKGKAFSVRVMAGKYTPTRVFTDGSPYYVLSSGARVPTPFTPSGSPNLVFEAAYDDFAGRLAAWARAHGVTLLHLPWYGQDYAELNLGADVRAAPGYTLSAWTTAHRRLVDIAARYSGPDLALELPLTGSGPLATGPSAALADYISATAGAGSDRFFVQANGWNPTGEWGTTSATTEALFDQIWQKPVLRGLQAQQPQDYDWTQLYANLSAIGATYAEVYLASFSLTRRDLLAAEIARFAESRCAPAVPADTTAPTVMLTAPADGARVAGPVTVAVSASDDSGSVVTLELWADGQEVAAADPLTSSVSWDTSGVADGAHDLSARAVDAAGNEGWSGLKSIVVDNSAPASPNGVSATGGDQEVTVAFDAVSAPDLDRYEVRMKPASSTTWGSPVPGTTTSRTFTGLTNGTSYDFAVRSLDDLANASAWSEPVTATPSHTDAQSPDVVITSPADGARVAGTLGLIGDATDDSGTVTSLDVLVDGALAGSSATVPATVAWDSRTVPDGPHQISASAVDGAGNIGLSAPVNVTVDNTAPPVPTGLVPAPGDGQVTVSFDALSAADLDGYEVRTKASSASTWMAPVATAGPAVVVTGLTNGESYDFAVRSFDDLANASAWSAAVSATPRAPDTQGPSVAISAPAGGTRVTGMVAVAMSATDDSGVVARVELLVDGVLVGGASGASTTLQWDTSTVADGLHSLVARAYDGTNNAGLSAPVSVTVDNTAPPVPTGLVASPGDRRVTVSFAALSAPDLAGYEVRMKPSSSSTWGTPVATGTTSVTMTGLTNGVSYDFAVRSKDPVGLVSAWSGTASAIPRLPDTQAPTTPTRLTVPQRNRTSIQICWTASTDNVGVAGYAMSRNGTQVGTTTATCFLFTGLTPNTQYTLSVRAYDAAGNFSGSASVSARTRS